MKLKTIRLVSIIVIIISVILNIISSIALIKSPNKKTQEIVIPFSRLINFFTNVSGSILLLIWLLPKIIKNSKKL